MKLRLLRRFKGEDYTIGSLFVNGEYLCDTLEDKVRDYNKDGDLEDAGETKIFGQTAIPYGTYKVRLTMSPKFKRLLPIVLNVRHFTGIRIHKGKTAKHTHGCILPGENKAKGQVLKAEKYEMLLVEEIFKAQVNGENIVLTID